MKPQDQELANIAEAAKRVMNKETELQPADKDFVDLHSIDKEKRRGSTPLTEKDIEEANEFTKAAAKAAVAGDDEFEFDGKKYPTEMDVEVAKKILGESTDLDEASIEVDVFDPKAPYFKKLLKKYRLKMKITDPGGGDGGTDVVKLDGKKKDIKGILKDPQGFDDDGFMAMDIEEGKFDKLKKKLKSINPETLGDVLNGKIKLSPDEKKEFDKFMSDARKMFGVEFVKSFESFDVEESTAEYAKSLEKIANDRKMKNLSKEDKATLKKLAAMMAKENTEEQYDAKKDHDMDPRSHVMKNKETGMFCVYDINNKKVAEFKTKAEADEYAIKNHDALMTKKK